jgi:hypothetical protein
MLLSFGIHAENIIRTQAPVVFSSKGDTTHPEEGIWSVTGVETSPWVISSSSCNAWAPDVDAIQNGVSFSQTGSDCSQVESRTLTDVLTNSVTGETKLSAISQQEDRTVTINSLSRSALGTALAFNSGLITAGRASTSSDSMVGLYARTNTGIDIGSNITNEYGGRVLFYAYKYGTSTCQLRMAVTGPNGWQPGAGAASTNAKKFLDRYSTVTMRDASGNSLLTATLASLSGNPASATEGGLMRAGNVSCSAITNLYNSPTMIKSVTADF